MISGYLWCPGVPRWTDRLRLDYDPPTPWDKQCSQERWNSVGLPWTVWILPLTVWHPRKILGPSKPRTTAQSSNHPTWKKKKEFLQVEINCKLRQNKRMLLVLAPSRGAFFFFVSIHSAFSQTSQNAKVIMSSLCHSLKIFIEVLEPAFFQLADCLVKHSLPSCFNLLSFHHFSWSLLNLCQFVCIFLMPWSSGWMPRTFM